MLANRLEWGGCAADDQVATIYLTENCLLLESIADLLKSYPDRHLLAEFDLVTRSAPYKGS